MNTNGASIAPVPVTAKSAVRIVTGPDGAEVLAGALGDGGVELGGGVGDPEDPLLLEFALPELPPGSK